MNLDPSGIPIEVFDAIESSIFIWGSWDVTTDSWVPSYGLKISPEEQYLVGVRSGSICVHRKNPNRCSYCNPSYRHQYPFQTIIHTERKTSLFKTLFGSLFS